MKRIEFTKVVASGNDFVIISRLPSAVCRLPSLAKGICDRKFGVGADGLLILEKSKIADVKMRIFNADGSEAEMCGNGARSAALYYGHRPKLKIETKAGIIEANVSAEFVRIKLTNPEGYEPGVAIKINDRELQISSINTGVPHAIIFVEGIENIDVSNLGRQIRYYESFAPSGTNVDFVEVINDKTIKVRTYERGVEDETLACGTGAAAAAIVTVYRAQGAGCKNEAPRAKARGFLPACPSGEIPAESIRGLKAAALKRRDEINVLTQGGEALKVYFKKDDNKISDVWLEGKVKIVYKGEY